MGSDMKIKEEEKRKNKKKRSSFDESEDEGKSKRRRTVKDEEAKSNKNGRQDQSKKKSKSHKSSKHHSDKEKKSKEKQKSKRDKHDGQSFPELSTDYYFSKNNEFATWLKEEKRVFFSDLSSEAARDLFSHFVKDWNSQKLEPRYYDGIETAPRTAHKWRIKK